MTSTHLMLTGRMETTLLNSTQPPMLLLHTASKPFPKSQYTL